MIEKSFAYVFGIIALIIWFIIAYFKKQTLGKNILVSLFIVYITMIVSITLFPIILDNQLIYPFNINFIPLVNIIQSLVEADKSTIAFKTLLLQFGGNILMMIPYGIVIPFFVKDKKWWKYIIIALIFPLIIEMLQLIIGLATQTMYRTVDIDDVILNFTGCIIGYGIYRILPKSIKEFFTSEKQST